MNNVLGCVETAISLFGGLDTSLSPTDLPAGLSPDNLNMAYAPGETFTRPPFKESSTLTGTAQIVYTYSFTKNDGTEVVLQFTADGKIWANGTQIGKTAAGNKFKVATLFNKAYIAVSDGDHGADVPLQYDGNYLDRVSQDGPGAAPSVTNFAIPQYTLVAGTAGAPVTITSAQPINPQQVQVGSGEPQPGYPGGGGYTPPRYQTFYTSLLYTTATAHGLSVGQVVTVAGNSLYNQTSAYVNAVDSATQFELSYFGQSNAAGTGGTVTLQAPLLSRSAGVVQATTSVANNLRPGYRVQLSGVADEVVGGSITDIVIDNEALPGIATITTSSPHGLVPGVVISIGSVAAVAVGGGIVGTSVNNSVATVTTTSAHGLSVGAQIIIDAGGTGRPYVTTVSGVPTTTKFQFVYTGADGTTSSGGYVDLIFPQSTTGNETEYTVDAITSLTSFQVPISYVDGTWTSGTITFAWNGTFYVVGTPSSTSFTYRQVGPDAIVQSGSGTITPEGQIAPGQRGVTCLFQTRTGAVLGPSPTITFIADGTQYAQITNIPIGPSNVIARIIAFTGANGGKYFYIPVAPKDPTGGFVIGTSTVISDNTTTSAVFDFSDEALLAATAIDISGNNTFNQVVLGPCLGFYPYAGRLFAWGERNKIQQFLNMGFEGGILSGAPNVPLGWNVSGTGTLGSGDYGLAWIPNSGATISQTAYQDQNGVAILMPNTQYTFRAWANGTVTATISSVSASFTATAVITASGSIAQADFNLKTPAVIPADMVLTLSGGAMDELEIIYTQNPYLQGARASYVDNPEAFDGVTGLIGPANDTHPIRAMYIRRDVLHMLTDGPDGSLYETQDTASGEPTTWQISQVAAKCGAISVWGDAQFETWQVWASDTGLRIYDGSSVEKMSQEVQDWWNTFNPATRNLTFLANDPYVRRLYIGSCINSATAPNSMYVLDYRELNTSSAMANSGPLHVGISGKMLTTDLTRKWSPWSAQMNNAALIGNGEDAVMTFCGGGTLAKAATYTLLEGDLSGVDDDYGPFSSYYVTYYMLSAEESQAMKLGTHRKLYTYLTTDVSGIGQIAIQPLLDQAANLGSATRFVNMSNPANYDLEFPLNVQSERVAFKVLCQPKATTTQAGFRLQNMVVALKDHPYSGIAGANWRS